jgi:hypothetical protein
VNLVHIRKICTVTVHIEAPHGPDAQDLCLSIVGEKNIDINSLHRIRTNFLNMYYKNGHNKDYPNVLFDYQKAVDEAGHLEAYNHWILMMGDEEAFSTWHGVNEDQWDSFVAWFSENPIKLDSSHEFYRSQY